ncbi:Putative Holliday junction resolvase [Bacteroides xylanisolvens]|nr:Putative Holliday junction resolvase [Bacteroides xylanisolvens]
MSSTKDFDMRIMSLDVGSQTIGVAVSDLFGWTAQGLETIRHTTREKDSCGCFPRYSLSLLG